MYRLRAVVDREATIKGGQNFKCLWHENGGVSHHVLATTPMVGTDVNTSDGEANYCSRWFVHRQIKGTRLPMKVSDEGCRVPISGNMVTHVDAYIDALPDADSISAWSTKCVVGKRIVSSREVNPMASLFCFC